jgi:hypothetical protein
MYLCRVEVGNELHRLGALRSELVSLRAELARFEAQQRDGSETIAKQIRDVSNVHLHLSVFLSYLILVIPP